MFVLQCIVWVLLINIVIYCTPLNSMQATDEDVVVFATDIVPVLTDVLPGTKSEAYIDGSFLSVHFGQCTRYIVSSWLFSCLLACVH